MTYKQAIEFLYGLQTFGTKLGLDNTKKLADLAGNPQNQLRFIHVAGTNGKGSTCAMLESIYRAAGLRVGLFTSPHLVLFGERIQVNRQLIPDADISRLVGRMRTLLARFPAKSHPTFFEVVTVMALLHFAKQKCDIVIWETGLGGRLDSTNIVTPLVSVITNVQGDHVEWLGHKPCEIAREKAGIIKPNVPLVTSEGSPETLYVLEDEAQKNNCPITRVQPSDTKRPPLDKLQLPLIGDHQRLNAALALATARAISSLIPVTEDAARTGLQGVQWPGRFQVVKPGIGRTIVLDCAHNPAGATALRVSLQKHFGTVLTTLVIGVMQDKDWASIIQILVPLAGRVCLAPVKNDRTQDTQILRDHCQNINPYAEVMACADAADALKQSENDSLVVVTGSLFFVGEAIEALQLSVAPKINERGLNDLITRR